MGWPPVAGSQEELDVFCKDQVIYVVADRYLKYTLLNLVVYLSSELVPLILFLRNMIKDTKSFSSEAEVAV